MWRTCVSVCIAGVCLLLPAYASDKQNCHLRDVSAPTGSAAYLLCEQGLVYSTSDTGGAWTARDTGANQTLHAIAFADANRGFVVGDQGTLLATTDSGKTWQPRTTGTPEHLLAVFALGNDVWTGGFDGTLLHSSDAGMTWTKQTSGTTMALESIFFLDPNHGWAVGWSGTVLRTADGGKKWEEIKNDASSWSLGAVRFRDLQSGWAGGFLGVLIRSKDGGATWEAQKTNTQSELTSILIDPKNGMFVAADDQILESKDGETWKAVSLEGNPFIARIFALGSSIWGLGEQGIYSRSSDGKWKRDEKFVPAGSRIDASLEDATKSK